MIKKIFIGLAFRGQRKNLFCCEKMDTIRLLFSQQTKSSQRIFWDITYAKKKH